MAPTWQQYCCHKIQSTVNPENPACSAAKPFNPVPAFINALFKYGHCVNIHWIHCDAHQQSTLFCIWMTVPTLKLSGMAGHNNPVHFYKGVFSYTNTVPIYRLPFQNDTTNVMTLACEKCVHSCTHTSIQRHTNLRNQVTQVNEVVPTICGCSVWNLLHITLLATRTVEWLLDFGKIMHHCPHLMVTFIIAYHTYLNVYTPFPPLSYFWPKSCHDLWQWPMHYK